MQRLVLPLLDLQKQPRHPRLILQSTRRQLIRIRQLIPTPPEVVDLGGEPQVAVVEIVELRAELGQGPIGRLPEDALQRLVGMEGIGQPGHQGIEAGSVGTDDGKFAIEIDDHARQAIAPGEALVAQSIIGFRFTGRIESETTVGGLAAIIPSIEGRAWRTGSRQVYVDPGDPWPEGYRVSDTWPGA